MLIIFALILLFSSSIFSFKVNYYNLTLGNPLNITNVKEYYNYMFYLEVKYPQELRIKLTIPNEIAREKLQYEKLYFEEEKNSDGTYYFHGHLFYENSIKYYPDKTVRIMLNHFIRIQKNKKLIIYFCPSYNLTYFNIIVFSVNPFYLQNGIRQKFTNILEYYNHQIFLEVKRFQRINTTYGSTYSTSNGNQRRTSIFTTCC